MPLRKGSDRATISTNISEMSQTHPHDQAVAAALRMAGQAQRRAEGGRSVWSALNDALRIARRARAGRVDPSADNRRRIEHGERPRYQEGGGGGEGGGGDAGGDAGGGGGDAGGSSGDSGGIGGDAGGSGGADAASGEGAGGSEASVADAGGFGGADAADAAASDAGSFDSADAEAAIGMASMAAEDENADMKGLGIGGPGGIGSDSVASGQAAEAANAAAAEEASILGAEAIMGGAAAESETPEDSGGFGPTIGVEPSGLGATESTMEPTAGGWDATVTAADAEAGRFANAAMAALAAPSMDAMTGESQSDATAAADNPGSVAVEAGMATVGTPSAESDAASAGQTQGLSVISGGGGADANGMTNPGVGSGFAATSGPSSAEANSMSTGFGPVSVGITGDPSAFDSALAAAQAQQQDQAFADAMVAAMGPGTAPPVAAVGAGDTDALAGVPGAQSDAQAIANAASSDADFAQAMADALGHSIMSGNAPAAAGTDNANADAAAQSPSPASIATGFGPVSVGLTGDPSVFAAAGGEGPLGLAQATALGAGPEATTASTSDTQPATSPYGVASGLGESNPMGVGGPGPEAAVGAGDADALSGLAGAQADAQAAQNAADQQAAMDAAFAEAMTDALGQFAMTPGTTTGPSVAENANADAAAQSPSPQSAPGLASVPGITYGNPGEGLGGTPVTAPASPASGSDSVAEIAPGAYGPADAAGDAARAAADAASSHEAALAALASAFDMGIGGENAPPTALASGPSSGGAGGSKSSPGSVGGGAAGPTTVAGPGGGGAASAAPTGSIGSLGAGMPGGQGGMNMLMALTGGDTSPQAVAGAVNAIQDAINAGLLPPPPSATHGAPFGRGVATSWETLLHQLSPHAKGGAVKSRPAIDAALRIARKYGGRVERK